MIAIFYIAAILCGFVVLLTVISALMVGTDRDEDEQ